MRYIECPDIYTPNLTKVASPNEKSVFLAGGISNCPDWQSEIRQYMTDSSLTLINPRRTNFPMNDPTASEFQITWEHNHLLMADYVSFWFPAETLCPITLLELGKCLALKKPLLIGIHPEYQRKIDVEIQARLMIGNDVKFAYSIPELAVQITRLEIK